MSWPDEEDLLNAHIIRVYLVRSRVLQVFIEINHFFNSMIKLPLIPAVQIISSVLQLANLALNLIQLVVHCTCVFVISLGNSMQALLELFLVLVVHNALVLHVLQTFSALPSFASLSLFRALLVVKALVPLLLNVIELPNSLVGQGVHLLYDLKGHL